MKMRGIALFAVLLGMALGTQAAPPIGETIWLKNINTSSYVVIGDDEGTAILVAKDSSNIVSALSFVVEDAGSGNVLLKVESTGNYVLASDDRKTTLVPSGTDTNNTMTHFTWVEDAGTISLISVGDADGKPIVGLTGAAEKLAANLAAADETSAFTYGVVADGLQPPLGLGAVATASQVRLDWNEDLSGELDFYTVYRSTSTPVTPSDTVVGSPTTNTLTDLTVVNGTTYYYAVSATDTSSVETDLSDEVSATPPTGTAVPQNPSALGVPAGVLLDWADDQTGHLDTYTVYRSTSPGVTTGSPVLTNVATSVFVDTDVVVGTPYYYAVTAFGTTSVPQESALSTEVSATPLAAITSTVLYQHIDASVADSVQTNSGGVVATVVDQSTFGNDAVDGDGRSVLWPSTNLFASGLAGFDMGDDYRTLDLFDASGQTNFLDFTSAASGSDGFAILVAFKTRDLGLKINPVISGGPLTMQYFNTGEMKVLLGSAEITQPGLFVEAGDTIVYALNYNALTGETTFWDSKNDLESSTTADVYGNFAGSGPMRLAGTLNDSRIFDGLIGEVKIFSTKLPIDEFLAERNALVQKWAVADSSGFDVWAGNWGVDLGSATDDWDNDGINNLAEYAFAGNPTNGSDDTYTDLITDGGLVYIHPQPKDDTELNYEVQTRDALQYGSWTNEGYTSVSGTYVPAEGDYNYVSNSVPTTAPVKMIRASAEY
ncbi:hypothetical protein PDESU_04313 [Pontiella desulfatans]|uniref:Fibronectin type-III domain-containing protein n=2 Tax=Pontiella desulfatans TaxID=2750659 RepID=A0A6C2U6M6_PONDE|nr:hypothetical protein PDESU_04313 [Pontiella desulfatans]